MAALIAIAAVGVFAAGAFAGIIGMVSVAVRGEEKNHTLIGEATGSVIRVGRWLNGVYIRAPRRTAADREMTLVKPASGPARGQRTQFAQRGR